MSPAPMATALVGLGAVLLLMAGVWVASLLRKDASLVDRFWSLAFLLLALVYLGRGGGLGAATPEQRLLFLLVTIWALRLAFHITVRNWGRGEDPRYRAMRERSGAAFPLRSLASVHWLQAVLAWIVAAPLLAALSPGGPFFPLGVWLGTGCWAVGFGFEAVGDFQLARFKADPANRGRVMDRGLWRYTRHPNYFGDAMVWWGCFGFAAARGAWWAAVGPALMTFLLVRVSGVALLERQLRESRPEYREYILRTSAFIPRPPRRRPGP